jgi:plastocyanin
MSAMFLLLLLLMGSISLQAAPAEQNAFVGCLNRLPNGTLQFGEVPSGKLFLLGGQTDLAEAHVNQLVRVFGKLDHRTSDNNAVPTLMLVRVQTLAESCTSVLPAREPERVPGKVGEDGVAVPITTTLTEDQTTPGFQTETVNSRSANIQNAGQTVESPGAPFHPEQVAQSEAAADVNASAVERTEILPGSTLGVTALPATPETVSAAIGPALVPPATTYSRPVVVTISGNLAPRLSPSRVSIRTGQTVEWLNSSAALQEIIANPARETKLSSAPLPAGVNPFDSGFLRHGHSFRYHFSVPGVYRYFCKVNSLDNSPMAVGEVVVER